MEESKECGRIRGIRLNDIICDDYCELPEDIADEVFKGFVNIESKPITGSIWETSKKEQDGKRTNG
jgi:hypothetical protein